MKRAAILFTALSAGCASVSEPVATGVVVFDGLTPGQLAEFRLIPEEGRSLTIPSNGRHAGVDGFWWQRKPGQWFKLPAGTTVTITPELDARVDTAPAARTWQQIKGPHGQPGWRPDSGATAHPTDDPFAPAAAR